LHRPSRWRGAEASTAPGHGRRMGSALDFDRTVNVTLGLPVPRTSPDHGVAYALAGKGKASAEPMIAALLKAAQLAAPTGRMPRRAESSRSRP